MVLELVNFNKAILLLGSNIGNRKQHLNTALMKINNQIGVIVKQSCFYKTEAWGNTGQEYFVNCAVGIQTSKSAGQVLSQIHQIETSMGRVRINKWEPRIIDIDILFFNNEIIKLPALEIPHPEFANRRFAIVPVQEIEPDLFHPVLKKNMQEIATTCPDTLHIEII